MEEFKSRTLDQEPDTIAIIPKHPEFMVVGTYTKLPEPEGEDGNPVDINGGRSGSLDILPRSASSNTFSSVPETSMHREKFPFGIYDIQFHPRYENVLGVATSDAEILFFDVSLSTSSADTSNLVKVFGIGKILVEEPNPKDGSRAIITKICFLNLPRSNPKSPDYKEDTVFLVATTQFGNTKLVQVVLQPDAKSDDYTRTLESQTINVHKQDWNTEAWTAFPLFTNPTTLHVLSGGDDSHLFISSIELPMKKYAYIADLDFDLPTPVRKLTDERSHEAGVVEIKGLGLYPPGSEASLDYSNLKALNTTQFLVLTGSYDENLRLFLFSPANLERPATKFTFLCDLNLGGGVWRITTLDSYVTGAGEGYDYVLLVAAHSAGAFIVRLSCTRVAGTVVPMAHWRFAFKVEKSFTEGHKSFVYAATAKRVIAPGEEWDNKTWEIISSSFYDKKVCNWTWVDEAK